MRNERAVGLFFKDNRVLLMWRYYKGREYYTFVGGTLEEGEDIKETFKREMFEEVNLDPIDFEMAFTIVNPYTDHIVTEPRKETYYKVTKWENEVKLGDPELSRLSRENIYRPEWVEISKLKELGLATEAVEKIMAL